MLLPFAVLRYCVAHASAIYPTGNLPLVTYTDYFVIAVLLMGCVGGWGLRGLGAGKIYVFNVSNTY